MKIIDHIGIFENFANENFCKELITIFEYWFERKYTLQENVNSHITEERKVSLFNEGITQFPGKSLGRKDVQFYLETMDIQMAMNVNGIVGQAFEQYISEYPGLLKNADPVSSWTTKIQKTNSGGGYHTWHCENGDFGYRDRVLTWMIYLNDIPHENGGATEFFHQKLSIQPSVGTLVLWPACYTHMHRGGFLTGDISKYIATGWFLREPGQVFNKRMGEECGQIQPQKFDLNE
jgi:hypothetical protein